ncbi:uncharacterized protein LOC108104308 isoform X2 [Drosophila eugracilis]|uniref:uncharacterized protein LOC108104308 isoform X2 n=1 Tax=Drosophila eugracilis TaxID=29029 RepID=UPI0007E81CE8|nr:uncharacterized protein LOC108104308 isoform X2 [Drosophila eugracilis]XP_017065778.1 uncharacterized protein LOC108104308 isoform X2 [Drosophila eugracilis]XP_017065779.1 uncharacterized protein LOC108104308 isoform X2 [Drosophila eugracilis]XP_017065780.1 uncharacterized protein LOC108104308 isoform X2 [Drosophila eugracilis]XP_017065781.1 uncharacterized protein LOC108104308 isoform X2 [Drosophila eugracilis]
MQLIVYSLLPVQKVQISQIAKLYEWMLCEGKPFPAGPEAISIFSAAKFLGIEDLMEQYWTAFSRKGELAIWEMTAFHIYLLAKELRCSEIMTVMFGRIRKCFLPLVASWEFLEFNVNEVTCMLSNDMLCVNSEDEIFFAAFYWLDFAWNERKKHAVKVMSAVRFGILSPWLRRSICNVPENDRIGEIGQLPEVCRWLWQGTMVSQAIVVDGQKSQDKYVKMHLDEWQRHKIPERYWIYCLGVPHHHDYKCSRFRELTYETFKRFLHSLHAHAQIFMDSLQFVPNKIWNTYRCCVDVTYRPYRDRNCRKPQFYSKGKKI